MLIGTFGRLASAQEPSVRGDGIPRPASARPSVGHDRLSSIYLADLINDPVVARELGLGLDRRKTLDESTTATVHGLTLTQLRNRVRNVTTWQADGKATPAQLDEARAALAEAMMRRDDAILGHLTEPERRRLRQIRLQRIGPRGITLPDVADSLRLADEQRAQARAVLDGREGARSVIVARHKATMPGLDQQYDQASRRLVASRAPIPEDEDFWRRFWAYHVALDRDLDAFEDELDARLLALLRPLQRKHYDLLVGEPLDIDRPTPAPAPPPITPPTPPRA